jgi:transcriptional regulator with XRE-family HTH domain
MRRCCPIRRTSGMRLCRPLPGIADVGALLTQPPDRRPRRPVMRSGTAPAILHNWYIDAKSDDLEVPYRSSPPPSAGGNRPMTRTTGLQPSGPQSGRARQDADLREEFRTTREGLASDPVVNARRTQPAAPRTQSDGLITTIGQRLAAERRKSGITQLQVATAAGSTQPSIARFERDSSQPNVRTIERYAGAIKARVIGDLQTPDGEVTRVPLSDIIAKIAEMRREAGVSQADVAGRMGATQPMIARLESGDPPPNLSTVERFANAMGLKLALRVEKA